MLSHLPLLIKCLNLCKVIGSCLSSIFCIFVSFSLSLSIVKVLSFIVTVITLLIVLEIVLSLCPFSLIMVFVAVLIPPVVDEFALMSTLEFKVVLTYFFRNCNFSLIAPLLLFSVIASFKIEE